MPQRWTALNGDEGSGEVLDQLLKVTVKSRLNKATYVARRCYRHVTEDSLVISFAGLSGPTMEKFLVTSFVFESAAPPVDPVEDGEGIVDSLLRSGTVSEASIRKMDEGGESLPYGISFGGEWATGTDFILTDPELSGLDR